MLWAILASVAAHHGDSANPDLLVWIKQRLDNLTDLGPWMIVVLVGLIIVAIPISLVLFYFSQNRHPPSETYPATGDEP